MTVGIIADTHGYLHPEVGRSFEDVSLILHAGDFGSVEVLEGLKQIAPVTGVYGNVDGREIRAIVPEHQHVVLEGVRIWMTHIGGRPGRYDRSVRKRLKRDTPDVFICGHSHILQIERDDKLGGMLFINPGAAGKQGLHKVKTCLRVELADASVIKADVIHLDSPDA